MTDLLISTPEELRAFLPSHVFRNLDPVRGFLVNAQNTFLRQRIGQPLISAMLEKYADLAPILPYPIPAIKLKDFACELDSFVNTPDMDADNSLSDNIIKAVEHFLSQLQHLPDDDLVPYLQNISADLSDHSAVLSLIDIIRHKAKVLEDPWRLSIILAQRCIVYDAFARSADIRALTDNDMGMNVAESDNFDAANDKRVERYKQQLSKEAHSATDMLLLQLEDWERIAASLSIDHDDSNPPTSGTNPPSADENPVGSEHTLSKQEQAICDIVALFKQSPTHYLCDGLLFNTATEFQRFIDIYDSRDRFVTLLPDIRYCQELHIESEIRPDLLAYLHDGHRAGTLNKEEEKAYTMLQRTLSLYVEARAKMFNRPDARDEACGYMRLTNKYISDHNIMVPEVGDSESSTQTPDPSAPSGNNQSAQQTVVNGYHNPTHHSIIAPPSPSCNGRPHSPNACGSYYDDDDCNYNRRSSGFCETSLI